MSEANRPADAAAVERDPLGALRRTLTDAAGSIRGNGEIPHPTVERPPRAEFGDYSTNLALLMAPAVGSSPREVAGRLQEVVTERFGKALERVDVAGPGFLNLHLADAWFWSALASIRDQGEEFGCNVLPAEQRERILVEFVSANPTGPLTVAGGRHAAFGDSLARVLEARGHAVEREYYVNDQGTQIELFGRSIAAAMKGEDPLEDGYQGTYVHDLAERLREEGIDPADVDALARRGVEIMVEDVRKTLERFHVSFDRWFPERQLHETGGVERTLTLLGEQGETYSSEGALWLRTTRFGDDKDRVLRRSSNELTYFATDIAYYEDKRGRGFDRLVTVLGADHHGYVARVKAAFKALGGDPDRLEILIMQLVHVLERGERAQMSKRRGDFVTLDELIDDIGVDAARFFMLTRSSDTALDIDLDLARQQSQDNPVYYVQYAHARIAGILRNAPAETLARARSASLADRSAPLEPAERALAKRLLELPGQLAEAAERRAPHRLTTYCREVAADFHAFYRDCRVIGAESEELEDFRLCLCDATRGVIASVLSLLGVEAPEQM